MQDDSVLTNITKHADFAGTIPSTCAFLVSLFPFHKGPTHPTLVFTSLHEVKKTVSLLFSNMPELKLCPIQFKPASLAGEKAQGHESERVCRTIT